MKPIPSSATLPDIPNRWHSTRRFLAIGAKFSPACVTNSTHFAGGPALHANAKCQECQRKLALLWNIDLADPLFAGEVREGFCPDARLALYICWNCMVASYRQSGAKLTTFPPDHYWDHLTQDESPYADAPSELPKRQIGFQTIPSTIDGLRTIAEVTGIDCLDAEGVSQLSDHYGVPVNLTCDLPYSQIGGGLILLQGHQNLTCPNRKCPASKLEHPFGDYVVHYLMKELATIYIDAEPLLQEHYFQINYHICWVCFSIRAHYSCT